MYKCQFKWCGESRFRTLCNGHHLLNSPVIFNFPFLLGKGQKTQLGGKRKDFVIVKTERHEIKEVPAHSMDTVVHSVLTFSLLRHSFKGKQPASYCMSSSLA